MEILNFISHSNHNVTIYIKENTIVQMTKLRNFYLDFPSLTITTYSSSDDNPTRSEIQIVNDQFTYFTESTQFNIVSNITLRLTQALNYSGYTSVETDISAYSTAILIINRWDFTISNIDVYRNVTSDKNLDVPFIIAIYEQAHTVTMINMDFHISGRVLRSNQPLSLNVQNVYMDFYGMMGGIYISADCNYPEASTTGTIFLDNVIAVNSRTRAAQYMSGILYYSGPANVTVQNTSVLIYGTLSESRSPIEIQSNSKWSPNDNQLQTITIQYNFFTLASNSNSERFVEAYIEIASSYPRQINAHILNNQITNVVQNVYPVFFWFFTSSSTVYLSNNTISNVSTQQGVITLSTMSSVTLSNSVFYNSSDFGHNLYHFSNVQNVTVQDISLQNITATGASTDYVFLFDIINKGTVSIDTVYMNNVNIGLQAGFYFNGLMSKISYTNMYFINVYIGNNNRMLSTGEFNSITINNITFVDTFDQYSTDSNNYMLIFDAVNLNNAINSTITDIYVKTSRVNFYKMENVAGSTLNPIYMTFKNITYQDCNLRFKESLITFSNVETQEQFYVIFDQFTFTNITFISGGYLMNFGHQSLTQVIISNLYFTSIYAGSIHLEANNKNLSYKTNVLIQNGNFENINSNTESIFLLNEGANLEIRNSSFNQISCIESGGIIYSSYQNTITSIYDSSFTNSTAVKAALFLIEDGSVIRIYRWSMIQNFAITSTLVNAANNGYFEIYSSTIHQNYAMLNIISEIFSSTYLWIIDNTAIYDNEIISKADILSEFTKTCRLLWFVPLTLRSYIISNPSIYNYPLGSRMFEIISAKLTIQNGSTIYNQFSIAKGFLSTITFVESNFYNLQSRDNNLRLAESVINITDSTIFNISTADNTNFVFAGVNTIVYIVNTTYTNWSSPFIFATTAQISIDKMVVYGWNTQLECIFILKAPRISILNSSISYSISYNATTPFTVLYSSVDTIFNTSISNLDQHAIYFYSWNVTVIDGLDISSTYGINIKDSDISKISNSRFAFNGKGSNSQSDISVKGGALHLTNSNFTIESSLFYSNTAKYGAAVYISCQLHPICVASILNTTFANNVAQISGGGVMYDLHRPTFSNMFFDSNSALYGPNIASYAIKVKVDNSSENSVIMSNAVSGQTSQEFTFSILDYDNQIINLDSTSKITIKARTTGAQVIGKNIGVANTGVAKMEGIVFISEPGSKNIVFSVNPNSIDLNIAKAVYGINYTFPSIISSFRYCKPGEYNSVHQWLSWSEGSYSFEWNSTQCYKCFENSKWEGDEVVNVDSGFWRISKNSTLIVEWPNIDACKGGYNTTSTYPVNWATGYQGILWAKWMKYGDIKYEKVSNFQCTKCAANIVIYIRIFGIMVGFILIILFIIYLKRKEGNERTILMRIMTNYVQIMTTTLAYNMNLPKTISDAFTPLKIFGSGTTTVFSFDCLSSNSEFTLFTPSPTIFKMFMMALTPLLLCIVISIVLGAIAFATRTSLKDLKRNLIASNVIILFLIMPTLIDTGLALFQCIEIDTGDFRVNADLDIVWYSAEHILWWFMLSMPILVVWVFGTQFLILLYLIKHRRRLNSTAVKKYFHIIYIGYRDERFYWEFVNTLKKFIIISLNVFLSQVSKSYKGMAAIITLLVLIRLQMYLKPYKLKVNNEIENSSMVAIGFTFYGGLLFIKGQSQVSFIEAFVFILIIIVNSVYIMFWVYLMSKTYDHHEVGKKISALLKIVLFRNDNDTVLTATNEYSSHQEDNAKVEAPIKKKKDKGSKLIKNRTLKKDQWKDVKSESIFMKNE